jgi:hypothetical protein
MELDALTVFDITGMLVFYLPATGRKLLIKPFVGSFAL